jgi:hypothetical protein
MVGLEEELIKIGSYYIN